MFVSHSDVEKVRTNLTGKDLRKQQKQQLRQCLLDMIVDVLHIVDAPSFGAAHLERPTPEHSQILQVAAG